MAGRTSRRASPADQLLGGQRWAAKVIFGEPKNRDEFNGGGHDRSAQALADGIKQLSEREDARVRAGGAVGLEGAWGSGKSTVIDIAKSDYLGPEYVVFTFDLWRHQADDFRRSLLEQFISFVRAEFNPQGRDERYIHGDADPRTKVDLNIDEKHDEVRNRQSVTTTTSIRRISLIGTILLIFLPLLPILYAAVSPVALRDVQWWTLEVNGWKAEGLLPWAVLSFLLYIAAALLGLLLSFRSKHFKDKASFWGRTGWLRGGASHLLDLSSRDQNNEVVQKIRDENPTTVEFRTVFEEILAPVQRSGRRVVFVLDNIDRIPADDLSTVWAEMRSLIAGNGHEKDRSVVAVIPYDRDHVGQAFPPVKVPRLVEVDGEYRIDRKDGSHFETDIFEKTFDRIIKVSAPVPSAWKRFLMERIEEAGFVGTHEPDYAEKLFRLLQYHLQREGVHPTPRRIISYINDIGGLWVQWATGGIPIATIGLYVLHKSLFDRDPSILSSPQPVPIRYVRIVDDPEYAKNLAALAFNVSPNLANQVRLDLPITTALTADNGHEALATLAAGDGFHEIFQDVLRQRLSEWAADSPESMSRAAINVARLELPNETDGAIWQIFADALESIATLEYGHEELAGLYRIVERQKRYTPEAVATRLESKFGDIKIPDGKEDLASPGSSWYRLHLQLATAIQVASGPERAHVFWRATIPRAEETFNIGVISAHTEDGEFSFRDIRLGCSQKSLSVTLIEMSEKDPAGYRHCVEIVGVRLRESEGEHWQAIAGLLDQSEPSEETSHLLIAAVEFLRQSTSSKLRGSFAELNFGKLADYALWALEVGEQEVCRDAILLAVISNEGEPIGVVRGTTPSDGVAWFNKLLEDATELDETLVGEIAYRVRSLAKVTEWIDLAVSSAAADGLFRRTLRALTAFEGDFTVKPAQIVENFDAILDIVDDGGAGFLLRQFNHQRDKLRNVFDPYLTLQVTDEMVRVLALLDHSNAARDILGWIKERLSGLNPDEWRDAILADMSDARRLLIAMQKNGGIEIRSPEFIQGLVSVAIAVLEGTFDPKTRQAAWDHVLGAIPLAQFTPLRAQLVARMRNASITQSGSEAFVTYLPKLAQKMRFSTDASTADMALTQFLWHLASSDQTQAQNYLHTHKDEVEATLGMASSDDVRKAFWTLGAVRKKSGRMRKTPRLIDRGPRCRWGRYLRQ